MSKDDVNTPTAERLRMVAKDRTQSEEWRRKRVEQRAAAEARNGTTGFADDMLAVRVRVEEGRAEEAEQDVSSFLAQKHCKECGLPSGKISICPDCQRDKYDAFNRSRHHLSQRFHELLNELGELHDKKQADYGRDNDPFANVRASEEWGIPGWVGSLIRANDKIRRLQSLVANGKLVNENAEDSLRDLAVYAVIALVLYEEGGTP